ncbi:MAG: hypothetical protein ACI4M6_07030 [Christensenellaceae bacterium]
MKKVIVFIVAVLMTASTFVFTACDKKNDDVGSKIESFYDLVNASQVCLDDLADDIYSYWYGAIYKDKYYGSIDLAIATAFVDNQSNVDTINVNEPLIKESYKEVKDSHLSVEIKAVMNAYSDYYELVMNVSGSFNSYSSNKETLKKALASALKNLALEM